MGPAPPRRPSQPIPEAEATQSPAHTTPAACAAGHRESGKWWWWKGSLGGAEGKKGGCLAELRPGLGPANNRKQEGKEHEGALLLLHYFKQTFSRSCFSAFLLFIFLPLAVGQRAALALPRDSVPLLSYIIIAVFAKPFSSSQSLGRFSELL